MRYRHLGHSGLRVSQICLGTMSFGDNWGFGSDEATSHATIQAFKEAGGNFLDTANRYHDGHTEQILAPILAQDRDWWVLATKYALNTRKDDPNAGGNGRKTMVQAVDASLKRLQTDRIDLLWVHAWDFGSPIDEVMRGLDDLVRAGKVLYVGVSDTPAWVVARANTMAELRGWSRFVGLQIEWSLLERTVERELVPMARSMGLSITPWGPMAAGILSGKYTRGDADVLAESKRRAAVEGRLTDKKLAVARLVDAIADEAGCTSAQAAVAWLLHQGPEVVPIVGARTAAQIRDILGACEVKLTAAQLARLDEATKVDRGFPHDFLDSRYIREVVYGDHADRIDHPYPTRA